MPWKRSKDRSQTKNSLNLPFAAGRPLNARWLQYLGSIRRMTPQDAQKATSKFATVANNEASVSLGLVHGYSRTLSLPLIPYFLYTSLSFF